MHKNWRTSIIASTLIFGGSTLSSALAFGGGLSENISADIDDKSNNSSELPEEKLEREIKQVYTDFFNQLSDHIEAGKFDGTIPNTPEWSSVITDRGRRALAVYLARGFGDQSKRDTRAVESLRGLPSHAKWNFHPLGENATLYSNELSSAPLIYFIRQNDKWMFDCITPFPPSDVVGCYYHIADEIYVNGLSRAGDLVSQSILDDWNSREAKYPKEKMFEYFESWSRSHVYALPSFHPDHATLIEFTRLGDKLYSFRRRNGGWVLQSIEVD